MKIQEKIRLLRHQQNLTQEQVAEKLDITPQAYSRIEQGKTKINIDRLQQLANIFDIDITDLMTNENTLVNLLINGDFTESDENYSTAIIYNSETALAHENDKLRIEMDFKDKIIQKLETEVANLQTIIDVLKKKD